MADLTRSEAWELLTKYNKEPFHLRHALTVEGIMKYFAKELGYADEADFWAQVGLLHDLDFVGNGGNGLTATASTMIENCSFTGYDIGAAVENGGMIGVEACTFRNNKIGFSYDTLRYSFSKDGFPDCRIEGTDVGIQFVNLPGAMPLDFFGTVFSGNGTDIDNPIQNPIDLSNAIFE